MNIKGSSYSGIKVFVHNGSKFDVLFILKLALSNRRDYMKKKVKLFNRNSNIISVRLFSNVIFIDSYRIINFKLSDVAKAMKVECLHKDEYKDRFDIKFKQELELYVNEGIISNSTIQEMKEYC